MDAGCRMSVPPTAKMSESGPLKRVPHSKPPFTLGEVKKAIPPHCFKRSVIRSFSYVVFDLITASLLYYVANNYFQHLPQPLSYLPWPIYGFIQGSILIGVWLIAHELATMPSVTTNGWMTLSVSSCTHVFLSLTFGNIAIAAIIQIQVPLTGMKSLYPSKNQVFVGTPNTLTTQ